MKYVIRFALPVFLAGALAATGQDVLFGPVRAQPGESVRLVSRSSSEGGTVEWSHGGQTVSGTKTLVRERDLAWTFRAPAADGVRRGMVSVVRMSASSTVTIAGKAEKSDEVSPLSGRMFAVTKAPAGDWEIGLDGSVPLPRVRDEIEELTLYLKRQWFPERRVKVGDSWEFDPAWIRTIMEKDFRSAQTIGTMKLRHIRQSAAKDIAVIDVSVRSTGGDLHADGAGNSRQVELSGQLVVNTRTMLDESLELKGVVVTSSGKPGDSKKVTLPIQLSVTKSFVKAAVP
jgi:hypothetical protein